LEGDESYGCTTCFEKTKADLVTKIASTNDIIVVNLKRYIYKGNLVLKNNKAITAPFHITIDQQDYAIFAFVIHCHSSTANTGHYKSYINCDTKWYEFDDNKVRLVAPTELNKLLS